MRRGFTLIELLVVISIIAVLASLLMPAIGAVRQSAQATRCLSAQRQLALAVSVYADQNDGLLVAAAFNGAGFWGPALAQIVHEDPSMGWGSITQKNILWQCPSWKGRDTGGGILATTSPGYGMNKSVEYPAAGAVDNDAVSGKAFALNAITFPTQRGMIMDANDWNLATFNAPSATANYPTERVLPGWLAAGNQRHGAGINIIFFDCHAAKVPLSQSRNTIVNPAAFGL